jgi:hypothetical protein
MDQTVMGVDVHPKPLANGDCLHAARRDELPYAAG